MCPRILVIEPDETLRELMALVLAGQGHEPWLEAAGDLALARLGRGAGVDLVLVADAPGLVVAIREAPRFAHLPVIGLTVIDERATMMREAGADAVLRRPHPNRALCATIEAVLASRRATIHP